MGYKSRKAFCSVVLSVLAILPEGSVRDETTFLILIAGLAALVGAAIYLRIRRKRGEKLE
ncbi:MAG: LPXTG cell wall anchor domain-containing protein [Thaumarchaeota archaeon]|nr:MAG: LPXTG cell wall anchor domain-containing protein [Nitrososphaerota archaeon]